MPDSLRILFVFLILTFFSGIFLFKNYHELEQNQRSFIKQERNTVQRMNYLEQIGRNDFTNYTSLLEHKLNSSVVPDTAFYGAIDSLNRINAGLIADYWLLIKSGDETADLDSYKESRNKYIETVNKYREAGSSANQEKELTTAFAKYHNLHSKLTNKQYSTISALLRQSQESIVNEIKTMIGLLLCCMIITILLSIYIYRQFQKLK